MGEGRRGPTPSRCRRLKRLLLASVDGCLQLLSHWHHSMGVHNLPSEPFQASRRAVIGIGRWVSTTSEPFQASTRAVIGIGRWVSTTSEPFQASTRAVIGIGRWVSTTSDGSRLPQGRSLASVDGCPQPPSRSRLRQGRSLASVDGCPQLPTHRSMGVHNFLHTGRWVSTTPYHNSLKLPSRCLRGRPGNRGDSGIAEGN